MASVSKANATAVFELKSTSWTLTSLVLKSAAQDDLAQALADRFGETPELFDQEPLAIDLAALAEADAAIDFPALMALLRSHRLLPIAVRGGSPDQIAAARAAGLADMPEASPNAAPVRTVVETVVQEVVREVPVEVQVAGPGTLVIDKPLRSGQQVYARGADLVVLAVVSFGAEVIADGHIHVYAPLRGRAIAGARGNTAARIFTTCMEPQLVSIAGIYRTTETALPAGVQGKPAQVRLDGEKLLVEPLTLGLRA
ncbi:MAG: septum site-determining protein MinC [Burkholderiales bacterium]